MEKRITNDIQSSVIEKEDDALEIAAPMRYTGYEQSVSLVCKFPANVSARGQVTGKLYEWSGAGTVVKVDAKDVENLLLKRVGEAACCGGSDQPGNFVFERI